MLGDKMSLGQNVMGRNVWDEVIVGQNELVTKLMGT